MKKYILLTFLFSLTYGRAIPKEEAHLYYIEMIAPNASVYVSKPDLALDTAKALSRANDSKQRYLSYFKDLEKSGKKINYALLSYILNQITVRSFPLTEEHLDLATLFLFMTHNEEKRLTERQLLDITDILGDVVVMYELYKATLMDTHNVASVKGISWLNEGVLQMAALEFQKAQLTKPLPGIIDYGMLAIIKDRDDTKDPYIIIQKVSAAFMYSTTNVITFPLNLNNTHWVMLAIQKDGNVAVIDSMSGNHSDITKRIVESLNEYGVKDHSENSIVFKPYKTNGSISTSLQHDGHQCGVHSLVYCTAIARAGSISGGLDIIKETKTGKKITFEDILNDTVSEKILGTHKAVFQNFRVQLQKLIAELQKKSDVAE